LVQAFLKKWWVESDFKAPNLPLEVVRLVNIVMRSNPLALGELARLVNLVMRSNPLTLEELARLLAFKQIKKRRLAK
jgi:hypothetical protein